MLKQLLADLADPNNFELDPRDLCVKFAAWHRSAVKLLAEQATTVAVIPDDVAALTSKNITAAMIVSEVTSAPPPVEQKDLHSERKVWSPTVGITKEPRGWEKFK